MSLAPVKSAALVWACTKGPQQLSAWLLQRMVRDPKILGSMEPAMMAHRLNVRLEQSSGNALPFANVLKLVNPETNGEVYLLGTLEHVSGSQAASVIQAIHPDIVIVDDKEIPTARHPHTVMPEIPLSNSSLQLLSKQQHRAKVDITKGRYDAAKVALKTAWDAGISVAMVGPQDPKHVPSSVLQAVMQRCLQLPPHLTPFDPVISGVLNGERSAAIVQRLRDASGKAKRVVCVIGLDHIPLIHTLWDMGILDAQVAYDQIPQIAEPAPSKVTDTLMSRLLPKGEDAPSPAQHHERAKTVTKAPMTQRAVLHWLRKCGGEQSSPFVRRRLLPGGMASLEWSEQSWADDFYEEVDALRRMTELGPDAYEPQFILTAWRNVAHIFANGLLLANGRKALDYPGIQSLFISENGGHRLSGKSTKQIQK